MPHLPSPIQKIDDPLFDSKGVEVYVKRDDLIHPVIMGNKWRKLKYNLLQAKKEGFKGIITLGGAYSNHIIASAAAASENGLQATGIIRGDELNNQSNPTLIKASQYGMKLVFVKRDVYQSIRESNALPDGYDRDLYFIPEGGTNELATLGSSELIPELQIPYDFLCTPLGTGGTMAGLIRGLKGEKMVLGFPVLKGDFIKSTFNTLLNKIKIPYQNFQLIDQYHFGGYAKTSDQLIDFINEFYIKYQIKLDPIYTGKLFYGVFELIKLDFFNMNHRIIIIHTGGVQGIDGYNLINYKKII